MADGIDQRQRAAPAAAEDMHFAGDIERGAQCVDVIDEIVGRVVDERDLGTRAGNGRLALAAAALVEQDHAIARGIEEAGHDRRAGTARSTMQEHDGLARRIAIFLPVQPVIGIAIDLQQPALARVGGRIFPFVGDCAGGLEPG